VERRTFLASGLGAIAACTSGRFKSRHAERPNVVLCMTDDQGWGDVGYNGLQEARTPNLDEMAASGVRFNRFYAAHPSCSPTRASVMTGRHPNRMGVFWPGMPLRRQEMTIAQALKRAGYVTGHFGKWHLNGIPGYGKPISPEDPLGPGPFGFDHWFSVSNWFDLDWTFSHNGRLVKVEGDGSDAIVAKALEFIAEAARSGRPFLAVVWYGNPHAPHKPLPEDLAAAGGSPYYGEIVAIDRSIGTLRRGLRDLGIAGNTIVWFCSDNGAWFDPKHPKAHGSNGPFRGRKGDVWEGGIRVPGIIEWPARIARPFATDIPACTSDIYPTLLDILGLRLPHQTEPLDGVSLAPLLEGRMSRRPRPIGFWQYDDRWGSVESGAGPMAWNDNRFKLVRPAPDRWELYDILADPSEKNNIAEKHPEVVEHMKVELLAWQKSVIRSYHGLDYPEKKVIQPKPLRPKRRTRS